MAKDPKIYTGLVNDTYVIERHNRMGRSYSRRTSMLTGLHTDQIIIDRRKETMSFFKIVFVAIFIVMFFQVVFNRGDGLTFRHFLEILQGAPNIPIDWLNTLRDRLHLDSGLKGLDNFVNMLSGLLIGPIYMSVGIAQLFSYAVYIMSVILGIF